MSEMDIIEVIRFRRYVFLALKTLLQPEVHQKLKDSSQQMQAVQSDMPLR